MPLDNIYSQRKKIFSFNSTTTSSPAPLPNSLVTILLLPYIFGSEPFWDPLCFLTARCQVFFVFITSMLPSFLNMFSDTKGHTFVSLGYGFCYSNKKILFYQKEYMDIFSVDLVKKNMTKQYKKQLLTNSSFLLQEKKNCHFLLLCLRNKLKVERFFIYIYSGDV